MRHGQRKGIFGLAVAAALVSGGAQAFAAPAAAETGRACIPAQCDQDCKARRFDGGVCSLGDCVCYVEL
ncbi:MAG TPA: hypothetical protein VFR37_14905 [Longimicrobium sp.]|nr:hypothetical protein [Longimicrobium sp.]